MRLENVLKEKNLFAILTEKNIQVRSHGNYHCLKYGYNADFDDELVCQCRGVIIKQTVNGYEIVCRPFDKFFNVQEPQAASIDWDTARVQQKIDGSIVKLWFDESWHWATNSVPFACDAQINDSLNYDELIKQADNYSDIPFELLNKNFTYIFELVSPLKRIVIPYEKTHLYHIGTREINGVEHNVDIGIEKPRIYQLNSLDGENGCLAAVRMMNLTVLTDEGFVVVDANWNRIKIKSPKYIEYHHLMSQVSLESFLEFTDKGELRNVMREIPYIREDFLKWQVAVSQFEHDAEKIINGARRYYEEFGHNRKAAAEYIKQMKYPMIGFWALDNNGYAEDFIRSIPRNRYIKLLKVNGEGQ